jgi:predicted Fe-Mo cluster-binding NifX family protein
MKIAVPVTKENQIESHIGNCESYKIFTISDKKEIAGITSMKSPGGCGCNTNIAADLASGGVSVVIAAGIGGGSTKAFNRSGIDVIRGCEGDATQVVELYLSGSVQDKGSSCHKHQPDYHHEEKHAAHRIPEIVGIHESSHQCSCGSGKGNSCSSN